MSGAGKAAAPAAGGGGRAEAQKPLKLTRPELLRRLTEAGKKPKGASNLRVAELLALCKRYKLASDAGLMDMDDGVLRY